MLQHSFLISVSVSLQSNHTSRQRGEEKLGKIKARVPVPKMFQQWRKFCVCSPSEGTRKSRSGNKWKESPSAFGQDIRDQELHLDPVCTYLNNGSRGTTPVQVLEDMQRYGSSRRFESSFHTCTFLSFIWFTII